jgi:PAS domain-containing protein
MSDAFDLDLLPDPVIRIDADRCVVAANAAADALAGTPLAGKPLTETLAPEDADGRKVFGDCWPAGSALRSVRTTPELPVAVTDATGHRVTVRLRRR